MKGWDLFAACLPVHAGSLAVCVTFHGWWLGLLIWYVALTLGTVVGTLMDAKESA